MDVRSAYKKIYDKHHLCNGIDDLRVVEMLSKIWFEKTAEVASG